MRFSRTSGSPQSDRKRRQSNHSRRRSQARKGSLRAGGQTLALLVGVDDYATLPDLRGAVSDARALEEALRSQ